MLFHNKFNQLFNNQESLNQFILNNNNLNYSKIILQFLQSNIKIINKLFHNHYIIIVIIS